MEACQKIPPFDKKIITKCVRWKQQHYKPGWCRRWWPGSCGWPSSWQVSSNRRPLSSGHFPGYREQPGYKGEWGLYQWMGQCHLLDAQQPGDPGPLKEEGLRVQEQYSDDGDEKSSDGKPEHEHWEVDSSELSGDDGDPGGEEGHGHGESEAHKVIRLLHLHTVEARDHVESEVSGCWVIWGRDGSREEGRRSGDDHDPDDKTGSYQEPVHAAVLLQEYSGQEKCHCRCREEDCSAVPYWQPLDSLEYREQHEATHHGLGCNPPPGGEVWRGEDGRPGGGAGSEEELGLLTLTTRPGAASSDFDRGSEQRASARSSRLCEDQQTWCRCCWNENSSKIRHSIKSSSCHDVKQSPAIIEKMYPRQT